MTNGGGIFTYGTVTLSGGTISGNTATGSSSKGGGIYNNGTLEFSGDVVVNSNNDVFLFTNKFITITGSLTGTAPVATIMPNSYTSGTVVLGADDAEFITANYEKFEITPQSDETEWGVNDEGKLFIKAISNADGGMYVNSSTGDDANKGTSEKPLLTLQEAATRIAYTSKASTDSYTINATGTFTATDTTPVVDFSKVKSGCSVTLKGPSAASKATIDGSATAQGIKVGSYDGTTKTPANLNLTLENMVVTNCNATRGAGILIVTEDTNTNTFTNCEVTNNSATHGGGIYNISGTLTLSDITVSGNSAGTNGGGIYNYYGTLILTSGTISGNTATSNGGGIYNNSGSLTINGGTIGDASKTTAASSSACSNKASNSGGGIYLASGTLTLVGGNISYNYAGFGGGIYNNASANSLTMDSSCTTTIKYNYADTSGGGIYTNSTFTMQGGTLSYNKANNGGGIFIYNNVTVTISGGTISNNTAVRNSSNGTGGHGISVWQGTLALEGGAKLDNSVCLMNVSGNSTIAPHLKITGNLTGTAPVATIIPKAYTVGNTVLEGDADLIAANYDKLALSNSSYHIDSAGKIAQ